MPAASNPARAAGTRHKTVVNDGVLVMASIAFHLTLAYFFGHAYDMRIFMATGYLVGSGQNPYVAQDLTAVFHNPLFQGMTSIGYFPPWALLLGLIYRLTYALYPNFLVYNLAIKLPVIAANLGLAYLTAFILRSLDVRAGVVRKAWLFLLFNPFLFYFGAAWGGFDALVALLALASLVYLPRGNPALSAIMLGLAVALKPTALPILPVALIYLARRSKRQLLLFSGIFTLTTLAVCTLPFPLLGWDASPILRNWNAHFTVGGALSFMAFYELLHDAYNLPGSWWLLGLAWVPALGIGIFAMRHGIDGYVDLLKKSTAMILIFFLTRTWLSEPNITLILPFVVILVALGEMDALALLAVIIIPLVFTIFNTSPPQLLFPSNPDLMEGMLQQADQARTARILARTALVIPWQIAGWWIVAACFRNKPDEASEAWN